MGKIFCTNKPMVLITSMLIGILVGCLFHSAPVIKAYLACSEVGFLEIEIESDDKDDSVELGFALHFFTVHHPSAESGRSNDDCDLAEPNLAKRESHLVRGPPL